MEVIKSLAGISNDQLFTAWEQAFRDYERTWNREELIKMLSRRGYVPELSFGAFDGPELVSFTLNATGIHNGKETAYDTGTGTIASHRGKGLATRIFRHSLPFLKQEGITQYLLEVLQHNTKAISVYRNIGFGVSRELYYFFQDMQALPPTPPHGHYRIQEISLDLKADMAAMCDALPAWQNSFDSIARSPGSFLILGAFHRSVLTGYGMIEPATGDIPQLAVAPPYRRQGLGTAIFKALLSHNRHSSVRVINTDGSHQGTTAFVTQMGIPQRGAQLEMVFDIP